MSGDAFGLTRRVSIVSAVTSIRFLITTRTCYSAVTIAHTAAHTALNISLESIYNSLSDATIFANSQGGNQDLGTGVSSKA